MKFILCLVSESCLYEMKFCKMEVKEIRLTTNGKGVWIFVSEFKNVKYMLKYFT